ncbi:MAG TPA: hypothetical protein VGO00_26105, partial [Kofleriaceae bacterium]|nr:hypothetical protein [Kofleriaceae bacterium]
ATVTAQAIGATLDRTSQTVDVPANGDTRVRFEAKASPAQVATFEFAATMGREHDAARVTIPIERAQVIETRTLADRTLAKGETWTSVIGAGSDVIRGDSSLSITVDRSGLGSLAPSLRQLVEYPYGCLEQTLSKLVPLVAAKDLATTLDDTSLRGTKLDQFVKAGIAKVIRHQQGDGLFSLWPQSQTYPHLAAYALWGLTVAQKAGVDVPADTFDRGIHALSAWANAPANLKPDGSSATAAMAAYVMAWRGKPDPSLNARLYALRAGLPRWGQAFLLRAMAAAKADPQQIAELEKLVTSGVAVTGGQALVHDSADELYWNTDVRASAMTLAALLEVDPSSPLVDPLARGLQAQRWVSTQDNLWSLVALAQYAKRSATGGITATIKVGGKVITKKLTGAEIGSVRVPLEGLTGDHVEVSVDQTAHLGVRVAEARTDPGAAASHGFTIARSYLAAGGKPLAHVHAGDVVTVHLTVTTDTDRRWVALVDPLPAGFEVVNAKLSGGAPPPAKTDPWAGRWQRTSWDHQDIRDDRVDWFTDHMWPGTYELTYTARATTSGTFTAMPASIEAMYQPDVRGRSEVATVTIDR